MSLRKERRHQTGSCHVDCGYGAGKWGMIQIVTCGLRERELDERAKQLLGKRATPVKQRISSFGKRLGPPWTQDEKVAAFAATLILGA